MTSSTSINEDILATEQVDYAPTGKELCDLYDNLMLKAHFRKLLSCGHRYCSVEL
jgi:hypothetical protein